MITTLDPAIAASVQAFNRTLPGAIGFVNTLYVIICGPIIDRPTVYEHRMLDAQQFLTLDGLTQTRTALGFA